MGDARRSRRPRNPSPRWDEPGRERSSHNRQQGSRDNGGGGRERTRDRRAYRSRSRSRQSRAGDRSRSPADRRYRDRGAREGDRSARDGDRARDARGSGRPSGGYRDRGRDYYRDSRNDRYEPRDGRDRRRADGGDDDEDDHRGKGRDSRDRRRRSASPRRAADSSPPAARAAGGSGTSSRARPAYAAPSPATAMPVRGSRLHEARHASPAGGDARSDDSGGQRNTPRDDAAFVTGPRDADDDDAADVNADDADETAMQAMLGFGGFASTKGKKIAGNNVSGLHKEKKTEYRQYMNRQGGFNRPLSPT